MAESGLKIEIAPIRTEEDRLLYGMWKRNVIGMLIEIILETRGYSKGEIDERMGDIFIDFARTDHSGAGDLGRAGFSGETT